MTVPARAGRMRWIHRLLLLRHGISPQDVLNAGHFPDSADMSLEIAADLHRLVKQLKAGAIRPDGRGVAYGELAHSPTYVEYLECARRLQGFNPLALPGREARLAFWVNLYNALIVNTVIQLGVQSSVTETPGFFWRAAYNIGGQRFAALDIENGVLRANAGHPAIPGAHFGPRDPRRQFSLSHLDPRIHFALVCAARSCPPIHVYNPESIDDQLDLAARSFIQGGGVELDRAEGVVWLSKIFQWYAPDFGAAPLALGDKTALLEYVAAYIEEPDQQDFLRHGRPTVRFRPYDWSLNLSLV